MNKKFLAAIAVLLIITAGVGVAAYQSLQQLKNHSDNPAIVARQAIEAHDLEKFNQCVDLDKLLDAAAKEILTEQINSTLAPTAYSMDDLQSRYDKLKPDFMDSARALAVEYILTGKTTFPKDLTEAQSFLKKTGATSCEIRSISKIQRIGSDRFVTVIVYNPHMKFTFELELTLEPVDETNWRITDAKGFGDYYSGYRRMLRRKLDSLNAPIAREMDSIFKVKGFSLKNTGGDEYGFSQTLNVAINADIKSDNPLATIVGNVILHGKNDRESFTPFSLDVSDGVQGLQTFNVTKTLNPFIRADVDAMKHGLRKKDIHIEVTEIIFADGTNLKLLDSLPD